MHCLKYQLDENSLYQLDVQNKVSKIWISEN